MWKTTAPVSSSSSSSSSGSSIVLPLLGNVHPKGYYYAQVYIGKPPKPYFLDPDTGSDLTWLQCDAPCTSCLEAHHPLYKPNKDLVSAEDPLCDSLQSSEQKNELLEQCDYEVEYADGASSLGVLLKDVFSLNLTNGNRAERPLALGCGYDQKVAHHYHPVDGVLGLGKGPTSILSQLKKMGVVRNVVGHCLSGKGGGYLFFGDKVYDASPSHVVWTPMLHDDQKHYSLGSAELIFDGTRTNVKNLHVTFDSGSSYSYLHSEPYQTLISLVDKGLSGKPLRRVDHDKTLSLCWKQGNNKPFKSLQDVKQYFKPFSLSFANAWWHLWNPYSYFEISPESYLIISSEGNVCLGVLNGTEQGLGDTNIIGDISMQDKMVYINYNWVTNGLASSNNKIWIFSNEDTLLLQNNNEDEQLVNCDFLEADTKDQVRITTVYVYGKHSCKERRGLWHSLQTLQTNNKWVVGGEFNIIAEWSEHKGKTMPNQTDMKEFKDCIASCNLNHPHTQGSIFTWSGGRRNGMVFRRLDRALVNETILQYFDDICVKHLSKSTSDHKPVLLTCFKEELGGPKPFRFIDSWALHPSFLKVVNEYWKALTPMEEAEEQAISAQEAYEQDPNPNNREADNKARAHLIQATNIELLFWKQKANLKWISEGDCNSKFYHAFVKGRRAKAKIRFIYDQAGKEHRDMENISTRAIDHFTNVFSNTQSIQVDPMMDYLEEVITAEDNERICKLPFKEEIKAAVWSLDPGSAPGPDGFNGTFFRTYWNIIKTDVISATQEFFTGVPIPKAYGSTFITLIPKNEKPRVFGDYRPISLSTFMSKINTRILVDRIQAILPKIISAEQTSFQKGMGVEEQILLVEEMVHKIDSKMTSSYSAMENVEISIN
ncbi:unnamed protein product [Cuscuta campestris]|uniref:Peptidase A1 domain-containing protein n=1 Tax=Cuscuta campestris TaxID=132261 RepID=A0A484NMH1_9ASTE|nr:unnamed protein product [Cuscuta campestris]